MEKFKDRAFHQTRYTVSGRAANLIAIDLRKVVASKFGLQPEIEIGGFSDDETRQIEMTLFGPRMLISEIMNYVDDHYDFEI